MIYILIINYRVIIRLEKNTTQKNKYILKRRKKQFEFQYYSKRKESKLLRNENRTQKVNIQHSKKKRHLFSHFMFSSINRQLWFYSTTDH